MLTLASSKILIKHIIVIADSNGIEAKIVVCAIFWGSSNISAVCCAIMSWRIEAVTFDVSKKGVGSIMFLSKITESLVEWM